MTMTMEKALVELRKSVEDMHGAKPERIGSPSLGDVVRQGDLYLVCIDRLPENGVPTNNRQLVPGTTQGSRHVVEGQCKIVEKVQYKDRHVALCGPAFTCESDVTVTHPEHGHKILPAGTSWHCVYQQAYADEIRRVKD
jgi:hypothetical protein